MRNLLIYINPNGFDENYNSQKLMEVQIENSLLFSPVEDILLVTDFPYEYKGIKSVVVPSNLFSTADATHKATKINVITYLIKNNFINGLVWFHDLDAFQLAPIDFIPKKPLGITSYEWKREWNTGSMFIKAEALPAFEWIKDTVDHYKINEEPALLFLTDINFNNINSFYEKIDVTYNVGMRCTRTLIQMAQKPITVAHFPPHDRRVFDKFKSIITPSLSNFISQKYQYI